MNGLASFPSAVWMTLACAAVAAAIIAITCRATRSAGRALALSGGSIATLCIGLGSAWAAFALCALLVVTVGAMGALGTRTLYKQDVDPVAFRGVIVRASAWGASWLTLLFAARVVRGHVGGTPQAAARAETIAWAVPVVGVIAIAIVAAIGVYAIVRTHAGAADKGRV